MNFAKRAWFAVKRKPARTIILLILFIAISNFVFAGIAIQHGTDAAAILARQKLGGTITLSYDTQKVLENLQQERRAQQGMNPGGIQAGGRVGVINIGSAMSSKPVPEEGAIKLSEHPDIIDFNFIVTTYAMADDFEALKDMDTSSEESKSDVPNTATNLPGRDQNTIRNPLLDQMRRNIVIPDISVTGVNATVLLDSFNNDTTSLCEGNHITASTKEPLYEVIIEKNLAEQNDLKVGDIIIISPVNSTSANANATDNTGKDENADEAGNTDDNENVNKSENANIDGISDNITSITLTIKGIYEVKTIAESPAMGFGRLQGMSFLQPYNMVYTDYKTALKIKEVAAAAAAAESGATSDTVIAAAGSIIGFNTSSENDGIDSAVYYVNDPVKIENIMLELKSITNSDGNAAVDWDVFKLDANNAAYEQMMGPIENVASFSKTIVWITSIAGALILALLLMLSIRERMRETGILLSMGEPKSRIIGQYVIEMGIVAVVAFSISIFSGAVIADNVSGVLIKHEIAISGSNTNNSNSMFGGDRMGRLNQQRNINPNVQGGGGLAGIFINNRNLNTGADPIEEININIDAEQVCQLFLAGMLIILAATAIPAVSIMKYNPKTILTKAG